MPRTILLIAVCAAVLATAAPSSAQTFTWNNTSGGNWNVAGNWSGGVVPGAGQEAVIDLAGTYTVSLTDNRSIAAVTVNQSNATLEQTAGDLTASGLFTLSAGTLHLTGGRILGYGGVSTAAGTTINLDGGQVWALPSTVGTTTYNGGVEWSSGELHGPGNTSSTFLLNGAVNLIGSGTRTIESRALTRLSGGGTWDAGRLIVDAFTQNFELPAGATITNTTASGNFSLDGDGAVGSIFNIKGTFIKQGANDTQFFNTKVNNSGLIDVQAGRLRFLTYNGQHSGTFQVESGATLEFGAGQSLNSGHLNVLGTGTLAVGWTGNTTTVASSVTVNIASTATVRLDNGGLTLASNHTLTPNTLEIGNGRLTVLGITSPKNLIMHAGAEIWGGTDSGVNNDMTIGSSGGSFTWEAGDFTFLRNLTVNSAANITGTGSRTLWGSIAKNVTLNMTLNGGGTWDAGEIKMNGKSGITIPAGATVTNTTASGDFSINPPDATAAGGFVSVMGTYIKQGSNTTTFGRDIRVGGTGHFDIQGGSVIMSSTLLDAATYTLAPGTTLQSAELDVWGGIVKRGLLEGSGTVNTPQLRLDPGGTIRPGLNGNVGVLTIGGNSFVNITGDPSDAPRFVIAAVRTGVGTADNSRIDVLGTGKINFYMPGANPFVKFEVNGTGLQQGETYTLVVATAAGGFQRNNGVPNLASGYEFAASDYQLILNNSPGADNVRLFLLDANTLALQFTPIPEPGTILGLSFAGLALARVVRRRSKRSKVSSALEAAAAKGPVQ